MATSRARLAAVWGSLRDTLLDAWALIQPVECLGCGLVDRAHCPGCRAAIARTRPARVRCDVDPGVPVAAAADYDGVVREALLALKDDGRVDAAKALAGALRGAIAMVLAGERTPVEVAWVPSRPAALRRRGFDPVLEILRASRISPARVIAARWSARDQKSLGRRERIVAVDRFRVRRRLDGRRFLLIDDVATTGATLAACTALIDAAGGRVVAAAVVCAPDRGRRSVHP